MVATLEIIVGLAGLVAKLWAFRDATRHSAEAFGAVGRFPRRVWLIVLGATIVLQFWLGGIDLTDPLGARSLTFLATVLIVAIYVVDTRPKVAGFATGPGAGDHRASGALRRSPDR